MPRLARAVFPGIAHHVTQRGNGRAQTFFHARDYVLYRDLLREHAALARVEVWGWVLMPNHVHLILVPEDADGLRKTLAPLHRYYAGHIHKRIGASGHFWQGRFGCVALDDAHLLAALKYVALNPVRANLCPRAEDWRWSSIHALRSRADGLTRADAVLERFPDIVLRIEAGEDAHLSAKLREAEAVGRPLGSDNFLTQLEGLSGRRLKPQRPGPQRR